MFCNLIKFTSHFGKSEERVKLEECRSNWPARSTFSGSIRIDVIEESIRKSEKNMSANGSHTLTHSYSFDCSSSESHFIVQLLLARVQLRLSMGLRLQLEYLPHWKLQTACSQLHAKCDIRLGFCSCIGFHEKCQCGTLRE